ncbi:MAG: type II 3-dehydroquinate dehydratase [Desulfotignum sp.]|nr:type II 3-dehydroquinate dehydratase [Desulfotignum sp.]
MPDIFVINGPNLNMLGKREPDIYGSLTLDKINRELTAAAEPLGLSLYFFQSNHEGALVDHIHQMVDASPAGVIINPGGLTHTSVVLRDALVMLSCPKVEVHLSNIYKREPFRHTSLLSDIVTGQITGFGHFGYHMALLALHHHLSS